MPLAVRIAIAVLVCAANLRAQSPALIGREISVPRHLAAGEAAQLPVPALLNHGRVLFNANWTDQEGAGRPLAKGTGKALSDPASPLTGMRAFNRISGPDANSCAGCHNAPFGIAGGSGDFTGNVFVLGQRFDFITLDPTDSTPGRGARDESGKSPTLQQIANFRATTGMFGAGYLEMLARQMTADLRAIRDAIAPGQSAALRSKGVYFGTLARRPDGTWDTQHTDGLPELSLAASGSEAPSLTIRPWHQAGAVVSLREFTNNAYNQHHGIQPTERFGVDKDPDGDGLTNEMTNGDVTAASLYQAAMAAPGRLIPNVPEIEAAVLRGEKLFISTGCASCHTPALRLGYGGHLFTEPGPYNPPGNATPADTPPVTIDLNSAQLPMPRLRMEPFSGTIDVPAYTDMKLHYMCGGAGGLDEPEVLNMQQPAGSPGFFAGNCRFLTKRLWDAPNSPPYMHHGFCTTMRGAIQAHGGEGLASRNQFLALPPSDQDAIIEFLKTLQVLPPGTPHLTVDENFQQKAWPPIPDNQL